MKKVIIFLYFLSLLSACIYVPWKSELGGSYFSRGFTVSLPYSFIWKPPRQIASIDLSRILLEIVAITALFGSIYLVMTFKKK